MKRIGLGAGQGKGYRNIVGRDPYIHSQSAQGIKQPQRLNHLSVAFPKPHNTLTEFDGILKQLNVMEKPYRKVWADYRKKRISEEKRDQKIRMLNLIYETKRKALYRKILGLDIPPKKPLQFSFDEYGVTRQLIANEKPEGFPDGKIVEMSPDHYLHLVPPFSINEKTGESHPEFYAPNLRRIMKYINQTGKISVGYLEVEPLTTDSRFGKVVGQEGRHTAIASKIFGIKKMPVAILAKKGYDPQNFTPYSVVPEYLGESK
jgi:hypothetical protein